MKPELVDFRCPTPGCGRLLFKVSAVPGIEVEVRCKRCGEVVKAELHEEDEALEAER